MSNQDYKNTWKGFTKFVIFGTLAVILALVILALFFFQKFKKVSVGSIKENINIEKRVAITPETAKNIITLGLNISLEKNYA